MDEAEGGTLFFDEIAEVPLGFQAKLLRFIETRKFRPLGETQESEADVRIIAATNKDIQQAMTDKEFREDLFYRLQVLQIEIPPLRQRKEDVRNIILEEIDYLKGKEIGEGFWDVMLDHSWPGNVRELITVLIRAGIQCESPITGSGIQGIISRSGKIPDPPQMGSKSDQLFSEFKTGKTFWDVIKTPYLNRDLNRAEVREVIYRGLQEAGGRYINLLEIFNIDKKEYAKFMSFLNDNDLR